MYINMVLAGLLDQHLVAVDAAGPLVGDVEVPWQGRIVHMGIWL